MDISTAQALVGILISLTVFGLILWHAVLTQERAAIVESDGMPPEPAVTRAPGSTTSNSKVGLVCSTTNAGPRIRVLAISQERRCRERLKSLADFYGWDLFVCANWVSAAAVPDSGNIPIVLWDRDNLDINWHQAFEIFLSADRSRCVVLCSGGDGDRLWGEVIRCGGYDVVRKPIGEEQVVRTVQFAWAYWKAAHPQSSLGQDGSRLLTARRTS
jgi:hypothetical protein